jgi:hypothetical protein
MRDRIRSSDLSVFAIVLVVGAIGFAPLALTSSPDDYSFELGAIGLRELALVFSSSGRLISGAAIAAIDWLSVPYFAVWPLFLLLAVAALAWFSVTFVRELLPSASGFAAFALSVCIVLYGYNVSAR